MILRPYQNNCVDAIFKEWEEVKSTLAVLATGLGKTLIAAETIRRVQPARALFLVHRDELLWQARKTFEAMGMECAIEMGELTVRDTLFGKAPIVVATVQTLNSKYNGRTRMSKFLPAEFGILCVDEAHRIVAPTYRNVFNYFTQNPKLRVLSITACPDRSDEIALGQICDTCAFEFGIHEGITEGWLVPIDQQFVSIAGLDFSHIRTTAGDLNGADLAAVMEAESNLQGVAGASIQIIGNRRFIAFTATVRHAEMLCNIFNRHRSGMCDWVCGSTNKDERREVLDRFKAGEIQGVANVGILTEGFDDPGVEVIVQARPTKSRNVYCQQIGRMTRPLPGTVDGLATAEERRSAILSGKKPSALVIDFVGNSGKHKLMSSADILGGKVSDDAIARAVKIAKEKGGAIRMSEALDEAESDIRAEAEQRRLNEEARKAKLIAKVSYSSRAVNPFDVFEITPVKERGWDNGRVLSERQTALLLRQGIDPSRMPYAQAKQLLAEMFRRFDGKLCTLKQAALLRKHGYDTKNTTMKEASTLIDALAKNGWRKPQPFNGVPI